MAFVPVSESTAALVGGVACANGHHHPRGRSSSRVRPFDWWGEGHFTPKLERICVDTIFFGTYQFIGKTVDEKWAGAGSKKRKEHIGPLG